MSRSAVSRNTALPSIPTAASINLPKGGGALRSIGEKFSVDAATGTAVLKIPLGLSAGRADFGPKLHLSYNSGAGNGAFGMGWNLDLPTITRKTDKGLPRYLDETESDIFILSGAEDLVPLLDTQLQRVRLERRLHGVDYWIYPYLPRTEGLFARIERWVNRANGSSHWRTLSSDNITTLYGLDHSSRIADPQHPERIFSYLPCRLFDDKGNLSLYEYAAEDERGINTAAAHEGTRHTATRCCQRYLKRIRYGAHTPYYWQPHPDQAEPALPNLWHFEVVFDYGDHHDSLPGAQPDHAWPCRPDPFSQHRAGFEVRSYRRCQRVLMFHHFPDEAGVGTDCLIQATCLTYSTSAQALYSLLVQVQRQHFQRKAGQPGYLSQSVPPLEFTYSAAHLDSQIHHLQLSPPLPEGLDGSRYQWVDLDGEGASGMLCVEDGQWSYRRNRSPLTGQADFGPPQILTQQPQNADPRTGYRFMDLDGDGSQDIVQLAPPLSGFHEREATGWSPFIPFAHWPILPWSEPNLKFIDLTGDGRADLLLTEDSLFTLYPGLGERGFGPAQHIHLPNDEVQGPRLVLSDGQQTLFMADMCGDGLSDLVRIRAHDVCYWPNLGYGRFGARVQMDNAPHLDETSVYDPRRVRLADIDGSGTTDLLYISAQGVRVWFNQCGNAWSSVHTLAVFPGQDQLEQIQVLDFLGNGTTCLLWSSPLPGEAHNLRYVDLMGGQKPHLMLSSSNNLGVETHTRYRPSTHFQVRDREAGRPWVTRLPQVIQVVEQVEIIDRIARTRFVSHYAYHHGHFDGVEREFRGFGQVEQWDTQDYRDDAVAPAEFNQNWDEAVALPPVLTRSWFHTGAFVESGQVARQYAHEYWYEPGLRNNPAACAASLLPDSEFEDASAWDAETLRQAYRAFKGTPLRVEVYAQDGTARAEHPYTVSETSHRVRCLQARGPNAFAVFLRTPSESLQAHYERQLSEPRVSHEVTLQTDAFGHPCRLVTLAYGRTPGSDPEPQLSAEFRAMLQHDQQRLHVEAVAHGFTQSINSPWSVQIFDQYRAPQPCSTQTWEWGGLNITTRLSRTALDGHWALRATGLHDIPYEQVELADVEGGPASALPSRRLLAHSRTLYRSDDLTQLLPEGVLESHALPGETYELALTDALVQQVYGSRVDASLLSAGGYQRLSEPNLWWTASGRAYFSPQSVAPATELALARTSFYSIRRRTDPLGSASRVDLDPYALLPVCSYDALENTTRARNDYRVLHAWQSTDANAQISEVAFDVLGQVCASVVRGKAGEGDTWSGFDPLVSDALLLSLRNDPLPLAASLLGQATSRTLTDIWAYWRTRHLAEPQPVMTYELSRDTHIADLAAGQTSGFQHTLTYFDGSGQELQHKTPAEPAPGSTAPRWVGSGWVVLNNKGAAVRRFEPFFSPTPEFEFDARHGVSQWILHDALQRVVGILYPDQSFEKTRFDAWSQTLWDRNDTLLMPDPRLDPDIGPQATRILGSSSYTSWYAARIGGSFGSTPQERAAARKAAQNTEAHADTPTQNHYDALGRTCLRVLHNGFSAGVAERHPQRTAQDGQSKPLVIFDAKGRRTLETCLRVPEGAGFRYVAGFAISGHPLYRNDMDAGERRTLNNALGQPLRTWDARGQSFRLRYDALHRPTHRYVQTDNGEILAEYMLYGESHPEAWRNLRGRLFQHYDGAGVSANEAYDFQGRVSATSRQLATTYRELPDWSALADVASFQPLDLAAITALSAPMLSATDRFVAAVRHDALGRAIQTLAPHAEGAPASVIQVNYNTANLLEAIHVWLRQSAIPSTLLDPAQADLSPVTAVEYDANGQIQSLTQDNGVTLTYRHDPLTRRMIGLTCTRPDADPDAQRLQDLSYTYDPMGHLIALYDGADLQNHVFFRNQRIDPSADYSYDPLYRLIQASGREHLGQNNGLQMTSADDSPRCGLPHPSDGQAMGRYTEHYSYDPVGNLLQLVHQVSSGNWTRVNQFNAPSQIDPSVTGNRLSATRQNGDPLNGPFSGVQDHDAHGNVTRMPHLPLMRWNAFDQLQASARQISSGTPETTYYTYDAEGQRVRKITERAAAGASASRKCERLYLGVTELYREYDGSGALTLERESLHVMLDERRVLLAESRTQASRPDPAPARSLRYHYGNHLGSASLDLDEQARVIRYEEYYPHGGTAYQAGTATSEASRRYRFTGKERDEENGLYYMGARYYAPWLGRWTACDPMGSGDGTNLYVYARNNPVSLSDPTGKLTWGQWAGIGAAIVVGTVITVATAGAAGPIVGTAAATIIGGIVGGAAGGAVGELVEAGVDRRPTSLARVGTAAAIGGVAGGVFAGAGAFASAAARGGGGAAGAVARTVASRVASSTTGTAVRSAVSGVARSAAGTAVRSTVTRVGSSAAGRVVRAGAARVGTALENLHSGAERVGTSIAARIPGTPVANAAAQASAYEAAGQRLNDIVRNGGPVPESRAAGVGAAIADVTGNAGPTEVRALSGAWNDALVAGGGTPVPHATAPTTRILPRVTGIRGSSHGAISHINDVEIKTLEHLASGFPPNATGTIHFTSVRSLPGGAGFEPLPACPACSFNLFQFQARYPGINLVSHAATDPVPFIPITLPLETPLGIQVGYGVGASAGASRLTQDH